MFSKELLCAYALHVSLACFANAIIIAVRSDNYKELYGDYELKISENITGAVVYLDPYVVCYNITEPPSSPFKNQTNFFLLTEEGICTSEEMAIQAEAANYSAIILYLPNPRIPILFKKHSRINSLYSTYNITAVLISEDSGQRIIKHFLYSDDPGSRLHIVNNQSQFKSFLIIAVISGGILIVIALVLVMIKCVQQTYRRNSYRLRSRHLRHLQVKKFKRGDPYETCAICLEDYKVKDKLRLLPCSHAYHCKCIDPWLTNNQRTCPVCKQRVNIPGIHDNDEDSNSDTDSRAETAPLIGVRRRPLNHGTFAGGPAHQGIESTSTAIQVGSGETTSRDVTSDALDDSAEEEVGNIRPSSSAPNILMSCAQVPKWLTEYRNKKQSQTMITTANIDSQIEDDNSSNDASSSSSSTSSDIESSIPQRGKTYVV